jgi:hypothetical protein
MNGEVVLRKSYQSTVEEAVNVHVRLAELSGAHHRVSRSAVWILLLCVLVVCGFVPMAPLYKCVLGVGVMGALTLSLRSAGNE